MLQKRRAFRTFERATAEFGMESVETDSVEEKKKEKSPLW